MFYCLTCCESFEMPKILFEMHYELSPPYGERFAVCPVCGDTEFDDIRKENVQNEKICM